MRDGRSTRAEDYRVCFAGDSVFVVREVEPQEQLADVWPNFCGHVFAITSMAQEIEFELRNPGVTLIISYGELAQIYNPDHWKDQFFPKLKGAGLAWATFLVMRRTFASLSKAIGIDAHTRSAQMGNTVDVNENEYAVSSFGERLAAVRKLESSVVN